MLPLVDADPLSPEIEPLDEPALVAVLIAPAVVVVVVAAAAAAAAAVATFGPVGAAWLPSAGSGSKVATEAGWVLQIRSHRLLLNRNKAR